jgi:peptide chain release factor 2
MGKEGFWEDHAAAQKIIEEANGIKEWVIPYQQLHARTRNVAELLPEVSEIEDGDFLAHLESELDQIDRELTELEVRKMLSGEFDNHNCFLSINAGAGGTEACDWVCMLARMYQRWAEAKGWKVEVLSCVAGDVAGLKSIAMKCSGSYAYGYAKAERGVHRLVRISPFDANARRHTSFASVDVVPEIGEEIEVEIAPDELRVDTYRASGAGGQHVNKTDSAVRMTHLPSGIIVSCQNERSQTQNRQMCLKMLRAKLYEQRLLERENQIQTLAGEKQKIEWGSQIRSYTFQPYTLVKDERTKYKMGNVDAVMNGEIDGFIHAYLKEFG